MKVYVAGPMRGYPEFNFPMFAAVAGYLRRLCYEVVSPHEHDLEIYPGIEDWEGFAAGDIEKCPAFDYQATMSWDLGQVAKCDVICMLPGWEHSSGARHERYVAEVCGKEVWLATPTRAASGFPTWCIAPDEIQIRVSAPREPFSAAIKRGDEITELGTITELRIVNETTGGEKGRKAARFELLPPGPLFAIAEHFGRGAAKYEDRNWQRGYDWSLSFGALMRHAWAFWNGEDFDEETKSLHLAACGFHVLALLEFWDTHPEMDDRPVSPRRDDF